MALSLCASAASAADVYRCEAAGKVTYTDRPCAAGAVPAALPDVTVVKPEAAKGSLAGDYDARVVREKKERDQADAVWLKEHEIKKARAERIRAGMVEGRAEKGMNAAQVRGVLGEPASVTKENKAGVVKERWVYRNGKQTQSVNFKDGEVVSHSSRKGEKKGK